MKTSQEVFDIVAKHLITQGKPAHDPRTATCYYRFEGLKCAVGAIIPDELYDADMECRTVSELNAKFPTLGPFLGDIPLLTDLQMTHDAEQIRNADRTFNIRALKYRLEAIANTYGLTFNAEALA